MDPNNSWLSNAVARKRQYHEEISFDLLELSLPSSIYLLQDLGNQVSELAQRDDERYLFNTAPEDVNHYHAPCEIYERLARGRVGGCRGGGLLF